MRESIVCEGTFERSDAIDMLLLHVKPRPWFAVVGSALVVLAIAACFLPHRTPDGRTEEPSLFLPAILVFLALYAFLYVPWNVYRLYQQHPMRMLSSRVEASDGGLTIKSERGEARLSWSDFRRWRSNSKVLLLYMTDANFVTFPARLFAADGAYGEFRELVAKHLGKAA